MGFEEKEGHILYTVLARHLPFVGTGFLELSDFAY